MSPKEVVVFTKDEGVNGLVVIGGGVREMPVQKLFLCFSYYAGKGGVEVTV
jgi:hypothetical protein